MTTTPDPRSALIKALARFCVEAVMADEDGSCILCGQGFDPADHDPSDCPVSQARSVIVDLTIDEAMANARAALATPPAPEAAVERCAFEDESGRCGAPRNAREHDAPNHSGLGHFLSVLCHPFQPTPPAPTESAEARLISEVDNDPNEWHHAGGDSCPYCTAHHDVTEARFMNGNKVLRKLAALGSDQ